MSILTTDASIFEIKPKDVLTPKTLKELKKSIKWLISQEEAFTIRGAGTSIAGQAIGSGYIVDISKHLDKIISFSKRRKLITVEPGLIQDDLNDFLKKYKLKFGPDTSTSNRANIGGMIGNNSCGSYSLIYGTTRENIHSLEMILSDGSEATFEDIDRPTLKRKLQLNNLEGDIYRFFIYELSKFKDEIIQAFPDPSLIRRNSGYAIDFILSRQQPFVENGEKFNLAPLICGSEGTLGVVTQATLKLSTIPEYKALIVGQFSDEESSLKIIKKILTLKPAAIEFIDKQTLDASQNNIQQAKNRSWIKGDPVSVLVIELFSNEINALKEKISKVKKILKLNGAYDYSLIPANEHQKVWGIRKAGLGLLMGLTGPKKAIAFIEDAAIPINYLHSYYKEIKNYLNKLNVKCVFYGHASVGLIHIRPILDLNIGNDKKLMEKIAKFSSSLVKKYKGSISGEHGDGRVRASFLKEQFGIKVYDLLVQLKYIFDPKGLLNPGVIIGKEPLLSNLRKNYELTINRKYGFDWSDQVSYFYAVEKCNGSGVCLKSEGRGIMCPSYKATRKEIFSTRGRANLIRRFLSSNTPQSNEKNFIKKSLDLCLGCKSCKTECPASVDMATLKSEFYFLNSSMIPFMEKLYIRHLELFLSGSKNFSILAKYLLSKTFFVRIFGYKKSPDISYDPLFSEKIKGLTLHAKRKNKLNVIILNDLITEHLDQQQAIDFVKIMNHCHIETKVINLKKSISALFSRGLLREAKKEINRVIEILNNRDLKNCFIVGMEASEVLTWRDEAKKLVGSKLEVYLVEEFLLKLSELGLLPKLYPVEEEIFFHNHCHLRSIVGDQVTQKILSMIPGLKFETYGEGCCGMAGDFGYKYPDISRKIFKQLSDSNVKKNTVHKSILVSGYSCKNQFKNYLTKNVITIPGIFCKAFKIE